MQYDKLGRLRSRTEFEGTSTWLYDTALGKGVGKLHRASFTPADGTLAAYQRTIIYDALGRPTDQTERIEGRNYTVSTGYDALSRVSAITYPSGGTVTQETPVSAEMSASETKKFCIQI